MPDDLSPSLDGDEPTRFVVEADVNDTPVREVNPVKLFGPLENFSDKDFRPHGHVVTFQDDDRDHPAEDGHGNFVNQQTGSKPIVHPSEAKLSRRVNEDTKVPEASDDGEPKRDSPFEA